MTHFWMQFTYSYMIQVHPPPMVWVPRTRPLDPDSRAICSISELQLPICTLFAPLQSPNPPVCALHAPLRSPNFPTYNLHVLFTSLGTKYIHIHLHLHKHLHIHMQIHIHIHIEIHMPIYIYMIRVRRHVHGICMVLLHPVAAKSCYQML